MMLKVCALGIVAASAAFLLKDFGWKGTPVLCLICFVGILSLAGERLSQLRELFLFVGREGELTQSVESILKVIGIGYLSGLTAESCRELGAGSVATAVNLVGRLEVAAVMLPYLVEIIKLGTELLG